MVGFFKVDCADLALSRRIFAGNCESFFGRIAIGLREGKIAGRMTSDFSGEIDRHSIF
jgi:hypothetical protein